MRMIQKIGLGVILITFWFSYLLGLGADQTIGMFPYKPYLGNPHCHTQYDDALADLATSRLSNEIKSPFSANSAAKDRGLKIQFITGHGEHLNNQEWQATQELMKQSYQELIGFIGIRGFELTGSGKEQWGVSTFDPRDDIGGFGHLCIWGSNSWCGTTQWGNGNPPKIVNNLDEFYQWVYQNANNTIDGGLLTFSFNHPSLYDLSSHFDCFIPAGAVDVNSPIVKVRDELIKKMATTIEMSSHNFAAYGGYESGGDNLDPNTSNEYWFHWALQMKWRLAPVASGDEHFGNYGKGPWTVFWLNPKKLENYKSATSEVLNALRERRVGSTEDKNCLASYYITCSKGKFFMGSILPYRYDNTANIDFHLSVNDADENIGKVTLVEVKPNGVYRTAFDPNNPIINTKKYGGKTTRTIKTDTLCYYIKIEQKDGNLIYLPPVWIEKVKPYLIARLCDKLSQSKTAVPLSFRNKFIKSQDQYVYLFFGLYEYLTPCKVTIQYPSGNSYKSTSINVPYLQDKFILGTIGFKTTQMNKGNNQLIIYIDGQEQLSLPFSFK